MKKIAKDNYIKYLNIKLKDYSEDSIDKYIEFYEDIQEEPLKKIFSIFHYEINWLLVYLNRRLNNGHYTADESRRLIYWIDEVESLQTKLKKSSYNFEVIPYYREVFSQCKSFLQMSGGSPIPENLKKIDICEMGPILELKSVIKIERNNLNIISTCKLVGGGSYANVYKYKDQFYNKYFAVKRAKKNLTSKEYERFVREYEEMKKLNSPYVIEVYNFDDIKKQYIMEYADSTLEEYIDTQNNKLTYEERFNLINQVFKAFSYINSKGVLHRDISTNNILIKKYDNLHVIKVSDFGLVKIKSSKLTSYNTEIKGYFNDPDLELLGFSEYSIKHEIYALTRVVYFIMTGRTTINKFQNDEFKEFIYKGISKNLEERYNDVEEMKSEFNTLKVFFYS